MWVTKSKFLINEFLIWPDPKFFECMITCRICSDHKTAEGWFIFTCRGKLARSSERWTDRFKSKLSTDVPTVSSTLHIKLRLITLVDNWCTSLYLLRNFKIISCMNYYYYHYLWGMFNNDKVILRKVSE